MHKLKIPILIIFLLSMICMGIFLGISSLSASGKELDASSLDYVSESVPAISTEWKVDELMKRASPEFKKVSSEDEISKLFNYTRENLGGLKVYKGAQGEASVLYMNFKKDIKANYVAEGIFEKGNASIQITLVREGEKWSILGYHINSEIFKPY